MRAKWLVCLVLAIFVVSMAAPASAGQGDSMVRIKPGYDGNIVINAVCVLVGCVNKGALDVLPGESEPGTLYLVANLPVISWLLNLVLSTLGLASVEPDLPVALADNMFRSDQASASVLNTLWEGDPKAYYGTPSLQSYLVQPAADLVGVRHTHCGLRATGGGIVAVIDTGIDTQHSTLAPHLVPGFDFTRNVPGGSEMADVNQASASVLNEVYGVNQATMAGVDQASASVLNQPGHEAFGHGTMVAGVIHLVAPTAKIMPLKAFKDSGEGYTSNLIRAIFYATHHGAKVINMSFSRPTSSLELKLVLDYASLRGVTLVASAGNNGNTALRYPAAYSNVIGVASTSNEDIRSSFSSYGSGLVSLAAPGEAIISTYPSSTFGAAWGSSFSAPIVSGAAALLVGIKPTATPSQVTSALLKAKPLTSSLGAGRVDLEKAIQHGRNLWPTGAVSPIPDTCYNGSIDWADLP